MTEYICIGVPYALGKHAKSPNSVEMMRDSGIAAELNAEWVDIAPDFASYENPVVAVSVALGETIQRYADKIPVIFASDCTNCWGAMKGLQSKSPAILWYDAHGDFNTPATSPSDYLGGMPLAALVGLGNQDYIEAIGLSRVQESDIILTDARNLDPEEAELVKKSAVKHLPQIDQLLTMNLPEKPLYIHFDLDVIDPVEMPALGYPEPDGVSLTKATATLKRVLDDATIAGVLFALYNNSLPDSDKAFQSTMTLLQTMIGLQD